jgi:hypothetical protein
VAGASTSEEVCPWETGTEPRSRKNSAQLDSGSSSSDISVAVAEVSERVQRVCTLTQQHTVDGSRKLSTSTMDPPRRASVSVPITHSTTGDSSKRKVSSFEDNSSAATSTSSSVFVIPSDTDNKSEECTSTNKTVVKNHSLAKACSVTGANAPIISVSSVADDIPVDPSHGGEEVVEATCSQSQEPLAPLAEPDSESPASELPPSEPVTEVEADTEAKSNDVCPWEDEVPTKIAFPATPYEPRPVLSLHQHNAL